MILLGDCLERLKEMEADSVDAVVTDPPYGLKFMNKRWDVDVPSVDMWREVLRVLKPGGHLLSFGGTRTYHHMAMNIELAGFEVRDQLQWLYGSGFPKSLDISKAIDKAAGAEREVVGYGKLNPKDKKSYEPKASNEIFDRNKGMKKLEITAPATPEAYRYKGWGTALKPANEPICLARKPLSESTVAANVLRWGVGGLNIDESRIAHQTVNGGNLADNPHLRKSIKAGKAENLSSFDLSEHEIIPHTQGRWPANLLLDESAAEMLDEQAPETGGGGPGERKVGRTKGNSFDVGMKKPELANQFAGPKAGASRFFYVAKSSKRERNAGCEVNTHPTVKPIKLMEYLIRLITPPNGTVLDPFCGSGSTGVAAFRLGFKFIGIEMNEEYVRIAEKRIEHAKGETA
jgi:DNA modification methylase